MKSPLNHILAVAAAGTALLGLVQACDTVEGVKVTFFGMPDNSPPGADTAYNCGGRDFQAGGTGTFEDPVSFASASGEFDACEIIYLPYVKKYLRMEDKCGQCESDLPTLHIDVWTGSATHNGGHALLSCENELTRDSESIVRAPPNNLPVNADALFDGSCRTELTFQDVQASCS